MNKKRRIPVIGITMGDPAGVGPELCLHLLRHAPTLRVATPVVFGDVAVLSRVARKCRLSIPARVITLAEWLAGKEEILEATVVDCTAIEALKVRPGQISAECGRAAWAYIKSAVNSAMSGRLAAVVTCPVHKAAFRLARVPYAGHTEMLAAMTGARRYCMMMASRKLCVSLVTAHLPFRKVPGALTAAKILEVVRLTNETLRRLGVKRPRLAVCGLNPHAGDQGVLGTDETRLILPAVQQARKEGIKVEGPLPPDTAFLRDRRSVTDAYIAMYHDQGLIPFKLLAFDVGVNITLGLPIVRTSVAHGTAFDIAWKGEASPSSLIQGVSWAVRLSRNTPQKYH